MEVRGRVKEYKDFDRGIKEEAGTRAGRGRGAWTALSIINCTQCK